MNSNQEKLRLSIRAIPAASHLPASSRAVLTAVSLCLAHAALAQAPASAGSAAGAQPSTGGQLQEVVVTAERRTENLQTTAIAATVLSENELVQKGVMQMSDLQTASPSLSITPAGLTANVNIRGIGLDSGSPSVVPGVASYRDGLWQPPILTTDSFYDVGSVEVLRGPQGTFVGSNSTGGAIFTRHRCSQQIPQQGC
jgi:iron complex outermembrane receptor protein